jgi:hypothetical protein
MLCGETVAVCCENRTEHTDTLWTVRTSQETQIHCEVNAECLTAAACYPLASRSDLHIIIAIIFFPSISCCRSLTILRTAQTKVDFVGDRRLFG